MFRCSVKLTFQKWTTNNQRTKHNFLHIYYCSIKLFSDCSINCRWAIRVTPSCVNKVRSQASKWAPLIRNCWNFWECSVSPSVFSHAIISLVVQCATRLSIKLQLTTEFVWFPVTRICQMHQDSLIMWNCVVTTAWALMEVSEFRI